MIAISYNVATYSPDYIITITVEIELKYSAGNIYIHVYFWKLPNMVSPITKQTPPLNSYRKTGPGHIPYVLY
jgi:hypothetical protein